MYQNSFATGELASDIASELRADIDVDLPALAKPGRSRLAGLFSAAISLALLVMVAFQFQDRVQQIVEQVVASIASACAELRTGLASGRLPEAESWSVLLHAGYSTDEQRAVASQTDAAPADRSTTFF